MEVKEIGTIDDRLIQLINHFAGGNKSAFGREAGIQSGVLAGLIGGRKSKPGFEILQRLLTAYPSVEPTWLLFGRGPMLKQKAAGTSDDAPQDSGQFVTREQFEDTEKRLADFTAYATAFMTAMHESEALTRVYRISTTHPADKPLSERLSVTEEEARELVLSGQIRSTYTGKDNERARRNGASYFITEAAVREFFGDPPPSFDNPPAE